MLRLHRGMDERQRAAALRAQLVEWEWQDEKRRRRKQRTRKDRVERQQSA